METVPLDECERRIPEVSAENRHGIGAEPAIDDLGVDRSEVGLEPHVVALVLERVGRGIERGLGRVTNMEWQPGGMTQALDNWLYTT